jgi:uncharacterized protein involved in exopolysaccharide biosynthesis
MAVTRVFDGDGVVNEDLLRLYDFFGALRARLPLIVATSLACGIAMTVLAFHMTPVYRGFAVLVPVTSDSNPLTAGLDSSPLAAIGGTIAALTAGLDEGDRETDEAMTVLRSREFTEDFIRDNNLLPVLFPKLWDARAGRWKEGIGRIPTLERGYIAFDNIRKIDVDEDQNFITLQIDWTDRVKAAEWANQMAERLNDVLRSRAIANADASLAYLQKELASTSDVSTQEALSRLMESEIKKKMLAHVMQEFEVRFIDRATVSDADLPHSPKKPVMAGVGLGFGLLVGIAASLLLYRRELAKKGLL